MKGSAMRLAALIRPALSAHSRRPFLQWLAKVLTLARSRQALSRLDDHLLRDIGLTRDQAEAEARRRAWDVPLHWKL
ncbi:DUF1127 domain-containing protein [Tabrizicola sp. YIM 78059]|uniref:DUF1127 domain-containing protein n=1 Tax=Tabrizicola sp. YIM 78059 TaxID=2529861 RepID=UPI0010AA50F3|nr:DUF1127 domain-containing protein [Tabrizicola sp. YIM 78059]